jgi:hypothetical protein
MSETEETDMQDTSTSTNNAGLTPETKAAIVERVSTAVKQVRRRYKLVEGRAFRKRDFFRICAAEKLEFTGGSVAELIEANGDPDGMLLRMPDGTKQIYLRSFFEFDLDTHQAAKWLGHHFLNHGSAGSGHAELEADLFAAVILEA